MVLFRQVSTSRDRFVLRVRHFQGEIMFRKLSLCLATVTILAPAMLAQTVDDVIAKHIEAMGGKDKIATVKTMKMTGKMLIQEGLEAPITMFVKVPDQVRMEFTVQGLTAVQAYDGKNGWNIMPFTGKKDPEAMSGDDVKELQDQADIWPLVDYKSKGNQVELLGKDKVEGTDAYKIKLTRKSGDISMVYLDADNYMEIKDEEKRMVRGTEHEIETSLGDYREVNGIMFPFAIESSQKGSPEKQKISIDKIELNVPVDEASFKMPAAAPAPAAKPEMTKPEQKKPPQR
jgi:hypothetical protein